MPSMPKVTTRNDHSKLFCLPFFSKTVVGEIAQHASVIDNASMHDQVLGMAVEIPFVPASQRNTTQPVEDSIVMVGQSRQKKRKRTKPILDAADLSCVPKSSNVKLKPSDNEIATDNEEPFDFSAVPNILDNNPDVESSALKKKRKHKSGKSVNQGAWYSSTLFLQVKHSMETFQPHQKHAVNSSAETSRTLLSSRRYNESIFLY